MRTYTKKYRMISPYHTERLSLVDAKHRMLVIGEGRKHKCIPPLFTLLFECLFVDVDPHTEPDVCVDVLQLDLPLRFGHVCLMSPPDRIYASSTFFPMLERVCTFNAWIWDPYSLTPI